MTFILFHLILCIFAAYFKNIVWEFFEGGEQFFTIETASGRVLGKQNRTLLNGKLFYSFRGIPFGKPPVNELRFKAAQYVDPWNGTLDATDFGKNCFAEVTPYVFEGHEDCLYLNVYVPTNSSSIDTNAKLPVMFYIYGGRLVAGASSHYAPDFLMEENVIVVTSNHRMGPFGFLSLNLPEYSGNMGLKDQALAIKWVSENIDYFGGDRNQITVCGHSSGAEAAHLQVISPLANHLFQKAIILSASALNPELSQNSELTTSKVYSLAKELNYSVSNEWDLVNFLNEVDAQMLLKKTFVPMMTVSDDGNKAIPHGWTLVVEDENAVNPFLTESPFDILTSPNYKNDIEILFNIAPLEAAFYFEQLKPELLRKFDEVFELELPLSQTAIDYKSEAYREIAKRIRDFYFDGKAITAENLDTAHMLLSDIVFLYGIDLSARLHSKKSNARTTLNKFSVYTDFNWSAREMRKSNFTIKFGGHPDIVYYLHWFSFDGPDEIYYNLKSEPLQRSIIENVAQFYANFMKFGNPMPDHEAVPFYALKSDEYNYYDITNDGIFVRSYEERERFKFWDSLLNEFKGHWNITFDFEKLE